jgi:hypothetical protein
MFFPSEPMFLAERLTQHLSARHIMINLTHNKNILPGDSRCLR